MFEKINNFVAEMRLNEANAKLNGLGSRYGVAQAAGAGASVAPQPRDRSLNQKDTILIAEYRENSKVQNRKMAMQRMREGLFSGDLIFLGSALVGACGAAMAAGALLSPLIPLSAPLLAFGFASCYYSAAGFFAGHTKSYIGSTAVSVGIGLAAGAFGALLPVNSMFIAGMGMSALGLLGVVGVSGKTR